MQFAKMHGAGNDFVVVDGHSLDYDWKALSIAMGDRHFGIGSDGLIVALPSEEGDLRMRMFNPDGSESEMCANGIRCFAKFAVERGLVSLNNGKFQAETMIGVLEVHPIMNANRVVRARVNQGVPILVPEDIPVDPSQRLVPIGVGHSTAQRNTSTGSEFFNPNNFVFDWPVAIPGHSFSVTGVSMGNPHAVAFIDTPVDEIALSEYGPLVEHHSLFPNRVNFEVVNVIDRTHLTARVWERGAGLTLACGSGACAIAVASRLHGYTDNDIEVKLPGGTLSITWDGEGDVFLEGPVEKVFEGEWPQ